MRVESAVYLMAGTMVLIGTTLAYTVSPWWLLLTAFVGLNLVQSAFTGFCPAEIIYRRLGLKDRGCGTG
jgi:hypothetical protein